MMSFNRVLIVLGILFAVYALGQTFYPSLSFRYRLTLEVETPGGLRTGSSVVEITESKQPKFGDAPSGVMSVRG